MSSRAIVNRIIGKDIYALNDEESHFEARKRGGKVLSRNEVNEMREESRKQREDALKMAELQSQQEKFRTIGKQTEYAKRQAELEREREKETKKEQKNVKIMREPPRTRALISWQRTNRKGETTRGAINIPTLYGASRGLSEFATPLTRNLGSMAGGAFIGEFDNPIVGRQYQAAVIARNAYLEHVNKRHQNECVSITRPADVLAFGTATEKKRILQLQEDIAKKEHLVAQTGFLSGRQAPLIAAASGPRNLPLQRFTQVGTAGQYGVYGPETLGRLGVQQELATSIPENKWAALNINTDTERISRILGKRPSPLGDTMPIEKIRRFTKL
jgi:hypothetical protein